MKSEQVAAGELAMSRGETTQILGWVERYRAGDDAALDELLVHFQGRLIRLTRKALKAYPEVGRWEQTDDVYQKAAMRLRLALQTVTPQSTREFFGLAALQVRRELLETVDRCRHRLCPGRLGPVERDDGGSGSVPACEPVDQRDGPAELEAWTEFHDAAAALPATIREAFELIFYGGLSQFEAARVVGVSERTIRNRWLEARLTISHALGGRLPGL
jgi:RNA polymerase sigma-70 factor (ECF subfamily)